MLRAELVPEAFGYFIVRPGVSQPFTFPTTIPADCRQILARAAFPYENSRDLHTIERVFDVPTTA